MKKFQTWLPHAIALIVFIILGAIYFSPQLDGYDLNQGDIRQYIGMSKEISDFRDTEHQEPLWTNSAFGGMPAYQISMNNPNVLSTVEGYLFKVLKAPLTYMVVAMISFYLLLLCFNVSPWLCMIGAIAFGFSSLNILFLAGGHNSKVHAIALMPGIIAGLVYAYRKNAIIGSILLAIFVCLHLSANHIQETYYLVFFILAIVIVEFVRYMNDKKLAAFFKISGIVAVAAAIGVLPTLSNLMLTNEYGKYTNRGKSELTLIAHPSTDQSQTKGLDREYIKEYSLGYGEIWSLAIPNIKGGKMGALGSFKEELSNVSPEYRENVAQFPSYWGEQSSTGGAIYFGAAIFLLFVLGMFFFKDGLKWAFLATTVLAVLLSWKNSFVLDFFIDHVPLFNKFRDTKMILSLVQVIFPLGAILFIHELFKNNINQKKLLYATLATIGLFVLFYLLPSLWFSFFNKEELEFFDKQAALYPQSLDQINIFQYEIKNMRIAIFRADVLRSIVFMGLAAGAILLFVKKKMAGSYFIATLGLLVLIDLWAVDKRYLNNDTLNKQWVKSEEKAYPFSASNADLSILNNEIKENHAIEEKIQQKLAGFTPGYGISAQTKEKLKQNVAFSTLNLETDYRVLALGSPFANATTSYYHKSLGGYHGAKLKKYAELIEFRLQKEMDTLIGSFRTGDETVIENTLENYTPTLNMLNTKYIIGNPEAETIINRHVNGTSWFVKEIRVVKNADEEIQLLDTINPKNVVVIQHQYAGLLPNNLAFDTLATIRQTLYRPNHLIYEGNTRRDQVAIFSEIYYKDGWNAYLDGKLVPYFCADYVLRGLTLPAGKHTIEFKFEPKTYDTGRKISIAGSFILGIFVITMMAFGIWKKK